MPSQFLMHQDGAVADPERKENYSSFEKRYFDFLMMQATSAYNYLRGTVECHLPSAKECPDGSIIFGAVTEQQYVRALENARTKDN